MLQIKGLEEGLDVFRALGSDVRMRIVELLSERGEMNMNELASALELTNGALTAHVKRLEDCGIIKTVSEYTGHGNQKKCSMNIREILLNVNRAEEAREIRVYETEVRVGHFSDYSVSPSCGLASAYSMIGKADDRRYFAHPERLQAGVLWFQEGYIEYRIPNMLPKNQRISQLTFCFEISSERQGFGPEAQSDVSFYLDGICIGSWKSPGDMGGIKGIYTPNWWDVQTRQYGLLKMIVINMAGTFLDGLKISDISLKEFDLDDSSDIRFRFGVKNTPEYQGGIVLYGSGFGNYNQDIMVRVHYVTNDN